MPASIAMGLLVLGGVLLLVAFVGGAFKIFGAEISDRISSGPLRFLAGVLGIVFILVALLTSASGNKTPRGGKRHVEAQSGLSAEPVQSNVKRTDGNGLQRELASSPGKNVSTFGVAIVFDPPSNIRVSPLTNSGILCSIREKTTINIIAATGPWYSTDFCNGQIGYIHRSQIRFNE